MVVLAFKNPGGTAPRRPVAVPGDYEGGSMQEFFQGYQMRGSWEFRPQKVKQNVA